MINERDDDAPFRPGDLVELEDYRPAPPPPEDPPEVAVLGADCPALALGHDGVGGYYFLSPSGIVKKIVARGMTNAGIAEIFDGSVAWLERDFVELKGNQVAGFSVRKVGPWLIERALAAGYFNLARRVRGAGAWRAGADAADGLVVHCGDRVMIPAALADDKLAAKILEAPAIPGYRWIRAGVELAGVIYPLAPTEPSPLPVAATAARMVELEAFLATWPWRKGGSASLVLGWLGCGMVAGALKWRPHLWVDGPAGAGKSTLEQILDPLFGDIAFRASQPTEAGLRQSLAGAAKPVLLDEMDSENDPGLVRAVIRMAKMASTDNQAPVVRGSAEGKASAWLIRACFYLTSITRGVFRPEDFARITVVGLDEPTADLDAEAAARSRAGLEEGIADFAGDGPALRARVVAGFPRFLVNLATFRAAMADASQTSRQADQLGSLLAMSATLTSDALVTADEAAELVAGYSLPELTGDKSDSEWAQCLEWMLSVRVEAEIFVDEGGEKRRVFRPLADLVEMAHADVMRSSVMVALRAHGVMVCNSPAAVADKPFACLVVANQHAGLEKIFTGTRWSHGRWTSVLRLAPGANYGERVPRKKFAGVAARCTWLVGSLIGLELDGGDGGDGGDGKQKPAPCNDPIDKA